MSNKYQVSNGYDKCTPMRECKTDIKVRQIIKEETEENELQKLEIKKKLS